MTFALFKFELYSSRSNLYALGPMGPKTLICTPFTLNQTDWIGIETHLPSHQGLFYGAKGHLES